MPGGVALWSGAVFVVLDETLNTRAEESRARLREGQFFPKVLGPALSPELRKHVERHWLGPARPLREAPDPNLDSNTSWFSQPVELRKEVLKKSLLTALDMAAASGKPIQTLLACFRSYEAPSQGDAAEPIQIKQFERFDATVQSGPNQVTLLLFCSPLPELPPPDGSGAAAVIGERNALAGIHWLDLAQIAEDPASSTDVVVAHFAATNRGEG
jgi:hypothetical protein